MSTEMTAEDPGWGFVRVLCVDDNRDSADSSAELLRLCGCDAIACYDGASAVELARTFRPAICFIDLNMPGMDGDEVARRMAEDANGPPLMVAVTAMDGEHARRRIEQAGFHLHLVKPADPDQLVELARRRRSHA